MIVKNISVTEMGTQVVVETFIGPGNRTITPKITKSDPSWSRLNAIGNHLKSNFPQLKSLTLIEVNEKIQGFSLMRQFSFVKE